MSYMAGMNGEDFRKIRNSLGVTQQQIAAELAVDLRTVRRWEAGTVAIPGPVELLLVYWQEADANGASRVCFVNYPSV